jgi:hypothetical protein
MTKKMRQTAVDNVDKVGLDWVPFYLGIVQTIGNIGIVQSLLGRQQMHNQPSIS